MAFSALVLLMPSTVYWHAQDSLETPLVLSLFGPSFGSFTHKTILFYEEFILSSPEAGIIKAVSS